MTLQLHPRPTSYTDKYTLETITPQAWVQALESGEYTKARGGLWKGGTKMCCLGVLSDMIQGAEVFYEMKTWGACGESSEVRRSLGMPLLKDVPAWMDGNLSSIARQNDFEPGYPIEYIKEIFNIKEEATS